ncbi:MAG: tRNA (N6-threonylcarbamoyladenosine(37)-N6)-methyltransferase TrmO [Clostridia bacterium]|nr:tRNA (N6-threonylcarbamoyladenosine(37)-N6)-methyltransferase TrmO [Clostridia bacterium]
MQDVIQPIGYIKSAYKTKFGVPRQAGIVDIAASIVFEPQYRNAEAFRGLEDFSHIWLLWQFSECARKPWTPTVRPPRLGGNKRVGVFATRSPFRPNSIGLSSVRLEGIEYTHEGPVLHVSGADLMDGTPIYDIKPYLPYTDCHSDATGGFTDDIDDCVLQVIFDCEHSMPESLADSLRQVLEHDPRPSYHNESDRIYGMDFEGYNVKFRISDKTAVVIQADEI